MAGAVVTALVASRFWAKVDVGHPLGCWLWIAAKICGYGSYKDDGVTVLAHRVAYEALAGPIPDGLQLDHLCRNTACVNPDHLEPVTQRDNLMRGAGASAKNATKTYCKNGHEFTPENTSMSRGARVCLACKRISQRAYKQRRREALPS